MKLLETFDFTQNSIFQYIGIIIVVIFIIYMLLKLANTQMKVVEGLIGRENKKNDDTAQSTFSYGLVAEGVNKELKLQIEKMNDALLIDKYRDEYEDLLINTEENINQIILYLLATAEVDIKKMKPETLQTINDLYKFKENLNSTMSYLDSK